jgi:hypothetical protein
VLFKANKQHRSIWFSTDKWKRQSLRQQALLPITHNFCQLQGTGRLTMHLSKTSAAGNKVRPFGFCSEPLFASCAGKIILYSASVCWWNQVLPLLPEDFRTQGSAYLSTPGFPDW